MTLTIELPALHPAQQRVRQCDARFIVLVTGRRWGKTRLGSALCIAIGLRGGRAWWVAPTYKMGYVGWRLLKALALQLPSAQINKTDRLITLPGGGTVQVRSGDDPDALRGEGLDLVVLDECAYMKSEVWTDAIRPALSDRKGRALFVSSPHGGNWFAQLYRGAAGRQDSEWAGFHFTTADNPFIDPHEIESARGDMSARLFRQEYLAEILEDVPGALWTRAILDATRLGEGVKPDLARIVVAVDPAVTATDESDETGIIVVGYSPPVERGYVLEDLSLRASPDQWARRVVEAYHRHQADYIVAEANNGGDMVASTLRTADRTVKVKLVHATRGKYTRAEPISALYEQGKVYHLGQFAELEDQMCSWVPGNASPDRVDALVWGLTELMLGRRGVTHIR